jgi:hypothetical protein
MAGDWRVPHREPVASSAGLARLEPGRKLAAVPLESASAYAGLKEVQKAIARGLMEA